MGCRLENLGKQKNVQIIGQCCKNIDGKNVMSSDKNFCSLYIDLKVKMNKHKNGQT